MTITREELAGSGDGGASRNLGQRFIIIAASRLLFSLRVLVLALVFGAPAAIGQSWPPATACPKGQTAYQVFESSCASLPSTAKPSKPCRWMPAWSCTSSGPEVIPATSSGHKLLRRHE